MSKEEILARLAEMEEIITSHGTDDALSALYRLWKDIRDKGVK